MLPHLPLRTINPAACGTTWQDNMIKDDSSIFRGNKGMRHADMSLPTSRYNVSPFLFICPKGTNRNQHRKIRNDHKRITKDKNWEIEETFKDMKRDGKR